MADHDRHALGHELVRRRQRLLRIAEVVDQHRGKRLRRGRRRARSGPASPDPRRPAPARRSRPEVRSAESRRRSGSRRVPVPKRSSVRAAVVSATIGTVIVDLCPNRIGHPHRRCRSTRSTGHPADRGRASGRGVRVARGAGDGLVGPGANPPASAGPPGASSAAPRRAQGPCSAVRLGRARERTLRRRHSRRVCKGRSGRGWAAAPAQLVLKLSARNRWPAARRSVRPCRPAVRRG